MRTVEADYVIVGAGTMGMAFADVLVQETDASVIIVDRRGRPGGHWTDAYPFVHLHQPSAFYGVNSTGLGNNSIDVQGPNAGLYELASNAEVCAYFDQIMHRQMLPSGRVSYLPLTDYLGDGEARSLISGEPFKLVAHRRRCGQPHIQGSRAQRYLWWCHAIDLNDLTHLNDLTDLNVLEFGTCLRSLSRPEQHLRS